MIQNAQKLSSYDNDFTKLEQSIIELIQDTYNQFIGAKGMVSSINIAQAKEIIDYDQQINAQVRSIESMIVKIIALRCPVANDLWNVIGTLKMINDLERVADYAANIVSRMLKIEKKLPDVLQNQVTEMIDLVCIQLTDCIKLVQNYDLNVAKHVLVKDDAINKKYHEITNKVITLIESDSFDLKYLVQVLFILKYIERAGDRVTNIVEGIFFKVTGKNTDRIKIQNNY